MQVVSLRRWAACVNDRFEALNSELKPIHGLYAVGNNANGFTPAPSYPPYQGLALGFAWNSGRIAGKEAAEYVMTAKITSRLDFRFFRIGTAELHRIRGQPFTLLRGQILQSNISASLRNLSHPKAHTHQESSLILGSEVSTQHAMVLAHRLTEPAANQTTPESAK